jgi:hypothetical protein
MDFLGAVLMTTAVSGLMTLAAISAERLRVRHARQAAQRRWERGES